MPDAGRDYKTPFPKASREGVNLPWPTILAFLGTCLLVGGGIVTKYIYATKEEVAEKTSAISKDLIVVQETAKHQAEVMNELKADTKETKASVGAVLENVNTVLREIGVSERRIAKPKR